MAASTQAMALRLNSTCSRTCQSRTRASKRFQAWTRLLSGPPARGLTVPMDATFPNAASRACTSPVRSGRAISVPPAAVSGLLARTRSRTSRKMAISSALSTFSPPIGGYQGTETAARGELADHRGRQRVGRSHHVAQHPGHNVLLKDPHVAICQQVHFVRFQFQTTPQRSVPQNDLAEIGQAGLGTHRSELRHDDFDFVRLAVLVGPCLNLRQRSARAGFGVRIGVLALHTRSFESRPRNRPTSATTPTACPVPRSLTLVATAGLISTQTMRTQLGSMLPVAIECSIEPRQSTRPAPASSAALASDRKGTRLN